MRRLTTTFLMIALFGSALGADEVATTTPPGVDADVSFSGTRHIESIQGTMEMSVRQAPGMTRIDVLNQRNPMTLIQRHDRGINYMLIPRMRMYQEMKPDQLQIKAANLSYLNTEKVGSDDVGDVPCTKYRADFEDAQGHRGSGHYWVSENGVIMKVEMSIERTGTEPEQVSFVMSDVKVGPQDPAEFEVPDGFTRVNR